MLYRVMLIASMVLAIHASQKEIQLPLDVKGIILSHVLNSNGLRALNAIKSLNVVNKEWHMALNTQRLFKQIVLGVAEKTDGYDEIEIAKSMRNWPGFKHSEFQAWLTVREPERNLENKFLAAAECNEPELITEYITQRKVNINARNNWGKTALSIAASNRHRINALQELLKHNPNINMPNKDGWTPLKKASNEGVFQAVQLLLAAGADPNKADDQGYTPLLNATFKNYLEIMKLLIEAGADVNHFPHDKEHNPLIRAVLNDNQPAITLLLSSGAKKDLVNKKGLTALDFAREKHASTLILFLEPQSLEGMLTARMIPDNGGGLTEWVTRP